MTRHRWRYEGGRQAQQNTCERCGLVVGWYWGRTRRKNMARVVGAREPERWPVRKPLPPCVEVKK